MKAFNENILKIHNAMNLDLGYQNIGSTKLLGISGTVKLIEYNIKNIDEWTKERPVHSNLMVGNYFINFLICFLSFFYIEVFID